MHTCMYWYCSTVQGLLDWFEVDLGFTKLLFIQTDLCVMCVFVLYATRSCDTLSWNVILYVKKGERQIEREYVCVFERESGR